VLNRRSMTTSIEYILVILFSIAEYLIVYGKDFSPKAYYDFSSPTSTFINTFNPLFGNSLTNRLNLVLSPLVLVMPPYAFNEVYYGIIFILFIITVYISIKYFSIKYGKFKYSQLGGLIAFLAPFYPFSPVPLAPYSVFVAVLPILFPALDYFFDITLATEVKVLAKRAFILSLIFCFLVQDPRTIMWTIIVYIYYISFFNLKKMNSKYFFRTVLASIILLLEWVAADFTFIYAGIQVSKLGMLAAGSAFASQLWIAYPKYEFLGAITGIENWFGYYNSKIVFIAFPIAVGLSSIISKRAKSGALPLVILGLFILAWITSGISLAADPLLAQVLGPFTLSIYPNYLIELVWLPIAFILMGIGLNYIGNKVRNLPLYVVIVLFVLGSTFNYERQSIIPQIDAHPPPAIPRFLLKALNITSGASGLVFTVPGNESYDVYMGEWGGWYSQAIWYVINSGTRNLGRALSYFGIQYILIDQHGNEKLYEELNSSIGLKEIYYSNGITLFLNEDYKPYQIQQGVYVAYDFPLVVRYLASLNKTLNLVPFYDLSNFSPLMTSIVGVVGINVTPYDILPDLANGITIDLRDENVWNWPKGWQQAPVVWTGDEVTGIYANSFSPYVIGRVPDGDYYVFVMGGPGQTSSGFSSVLVRSGSHYVQAWFNETGFAPYPEWSFAGQLNVTGDVVLTPGEGNSLPYVIEVKMIPSSLWNMSMTEANGFLSRIDLYNFSSRGSFAHHPPHVNSTLTSVSVFEGYVWLVLEYGTLAKVLNTEYRYSYYYGEGNIYLVKERTPSIYIEKPSSGLIAAAINVIVVILMYLFLFKKEIIIRLWNKSKLTKIFK